MRINQEGLDLIKSFEGLRLKAYQDGGGVWTIGYGHTRDVMKGDTLSKAQAEALFLKEIQDQEQALSRLLGDNGIMVNENEFSALLSFIYNLGTLALAHSTLFKLLVNKAQPKPEVAKQFLRWNHDNGVVVPGLTRRREAEAALFLK